MTVLFAGGEWDALVKPSGTPVWSTLSTYRDSNFARGAVVGYGEMVLPTPVTECWFHAEYYQATQFYNGQSTLTFYNSVGTGVLRLQNTATNVVQLQYYSGSAWVSIGATGMAPVTLQQLDIHIRIADTGGIFEVFVNGIQTAIYTGDTNLFAGANISKASIHDNAYNCYWSQMIFTDTDDTRAMKLATLGINANGTPQEWTGSYTDIDEVGIYNDADYISSATPNQVSMFALSDLSTTAATLDVIAVVTSSRGRRGAAGPQNLQVGVKAGGVDYFSGNLPGLTPVFNTLPQVIWSTNPNTSLPWSTGDINALQIGFKSVT